MLNFDLKNSSIYPALRWSFYFKIIRVLKTASFLIFLFLVPLLIQELMIKGFSDVKSEFFLGLSAVLFSLTYIFWVQELFFNSKLKRPRLKTTIDEALACLNKYNLDKYNLAEFLSLEAAQAVDKALNYSKVNSSCLLYFLINDNDKLDFVFRRLLLDKESIKERLKREMGNSKDNNLESFERAVIYSLKTAQKKEHLRVEIGDMLVALSQCDNVFKKILVESDLKSDDIENLTWWFENIQQRKIKRRRFWDYDNLVRKGTLAKEWASGYTITLDRYSTDITESIRKSLPDIIGHEEEVRLMERILSRGQISNVLIVGEPGTGRKSMVYALAEKSLLGQGLAQVNYKRIVELDISSISAEFNNIEEVESVLNKIFEESAAAGNVILVINEFHNYIGQGFRPGILDISGILVPYLSLPGFQVVAITSYEGLHRYIEKNPSILSLFEKLEVSEITTRETLMLLENLSLVLERKYKKIISYQTLREIISLTDRYMPNFSFPEKAMEVLEETVIYTASAVKDKIVLPKHASKVISRKSEIPIGEIESKEREVLLNLEELMHRRIINQEEAVREVSTALRRARSDIAIKSGPMGCFLFLGPTGVGKTETAKAITEIYFGSEKKIIRLDMSEFQNIKDIPRLIGSNFEPGLLTTPVRENPFSLVLLDEIEKANLNILNLFLQVLDEGFLTDGAGKKVVFKNTIIIATSNAGYKVILEALKEKSDWSKVKQRLLDYLFKNRIFRPEFINRFDGVVVFTPLSKKNLLDIANLMLSKLKKNLEEKGIDFSITDSLKSKIAELGYNPVFGAREMRRVVQDKVENIFAEALLKGELKRGMRVEVNPKDFKLIIK
ncbi:MAG: ATP-dependent Clp protease ATP-binding subunit [Candidatus Pacebacteria bacterium]|nr:ATP-dependent Clp protease ATP-binding subunit [Candidatus Paceibacterota bacterium]